MTISKRANVKNVLNSFNLYNTSGKFEKNSQGSETHYGKTTKQDQKNVAEKELEECENCLQRSLPKYCSLAMLYRRLPFTRWVPLYNWGYLVRDFIAGITVGLTAIPQGIAYANVAGLEPQYGLYSTIMPCFLYVIFGGCKDLTLGPTAIMSLMTHPYSVMYGPACAILLCFLSGVVILLLSILQLGFLVDFISLPVTIGFTAAAAFTIASAQVKNFLGLKIEADGAIQNWIIAFSNLDKIRWADTALGCSTILILFLTRYLKNKSTTFHRRGQTRERMISYALWLVGLSGNAIVVVMGSSIAYILTRDNVSPFILTGEVSGGLPPFELPAFNVDNKSFIEIVKDMGSAVIAVPMISIMETIAIGKAFERGKGVDATQEMIALGLSNMAGAFISSIPISGSFTRSAINNTSGVKTPFGGFFTGVFVLMALGFMTKLFYYIPKATLAGLIITAMLFMVEYHTIAIIWRTKKSDIIPMLGAFGACLCFSIEVGMIVGIATNLCFILYFSARPSIKSTWLTVNVHKLMYFQPKQSLLFPASDYVRQVIIESCKKGDDFGFVVLDGSLIHRIDTTTAKSLVSLNCDLRARGLQLILWKWNESPIRTCYNYSDILRPCFRYDDNLEKVLCDVAGTPSTELSTEREFMTNIPSRENSTDVFNVV